MLRILACSVVLMLTSCTGHSDDKSPQEPLAPAPEITASMPLDQAFTAAVNHGGETLTKVKTLLKKRHETDKAGQMALALLQKNPEGLESRQLINASHLVLASAVPLPAKLYSQMVSSSRPLARQLAWFMAARKPTPELARAIELELSRALTENDEDQVLLPQMAEAVAAHRLREAYTLVRQGLMKHGNEEFARTMIVLKPAVAANDFLSYLGQAPVEELRQLTMTSVNSYTCLVILKHLRRYPPELGRAGFEQLFAFAVSRNSAFADHAQVVLEAYVPQNTEVIGQLLARQPVWLQMAFLENTRRGMSTKLRMILSELKKATAEVDVAKEIEEIRL